MYLVSSLIAISSTTLLFINFNDFTQRLRCDMDKNDLLIHKSMNKVVTNTPTKHLANLDLIKQGCYTSLFNNKIIYSLKGNLGNE